MSRTTFRATLGATAMQNPGGQCGIGGPADSWVPVSEYREKDEDPEHNQADPQDGIRHLGLHLRPRVNWSFRPSERCVVRASRARFDPTFDAETGRLAGSVPRVRDAPPTSVG
ncbi:hypothetical protein GCM10023318_05000 [Nocardia callitridis]|uniref:Uncharacterized protein n=1 Tax=Nocardia callitridis TaxID=648753 RepID=A0ABP9JV14_9NOCA